MASAALETLRRLRKKGETVSTPKPSRPPLRAVEPVLVPPPTLAAEETPETTAHDGPSIPTVEAAAALAPPTMGGAKDAPFEVRLVPLEELTKLDRLVIRLTFGTDRTE